MGVIRQTVFKPGNPRRVRRITPAANPTYEITVTNGVIGKFDKRFGAGLPGMSLARDGQRQAHMGEAERL
ncbi:hypothetical protein MS5N3_03930 [Marinobacter salsuginis]|uniref:Uncharacterized protein n=1 Tax=Marinobacter salsuginis TaxID=418719 RepID=A0A5M3PJ49_9GAMM|nr:hypothetical protein MS5N3_03930 [Marinobacter salsuginis]